MSFKPSGSVAERRLRPLWDAIDSRQYKSALKLATSLLAKHPDSIYLVVLKALVLERMGKSEEALALCEQAKASVPVDDLTLSTLQIVFQRLGHSEQATLCYENACSKSPNSVDLMMGLFNCYVRDYSFLKQQQVAMKMYKLFGEERFLLWVICSIQLQIFCGNGGKQLLSLGEALLKKRLDSHGFEELEALLIYITLLKHEGKYDIALETLSTKFGELFSIRTDKLKLKGNLLLLSCQYEHAVKVFQELLENSSDDWDAFLCYLDATLEIPVHNLSEPKINGIPTSFPYEEAVTRLQQADIFLKRLQNNDDNKLRRGPYLGCVEIEKRRYLLQLWHGESNATCKNLSASIVSYFERFGHLVSFTSDIKCYLELIQRHERGDFMEHLYSSYSAADEQNAVHNLRKKVSLLQVEFQLGLSAESSIKDLQMKAIDVTRIYVDGLKLSRDLDPQESVHGEELIALAVSFLIQIFLCTRDPGYVVESIFLLEFGLTVRKFSSQYKIMLINLYSTLFCTSAAFAWYNTLDIKNILVETMSHHVLPCLIDSTRWAEQDLVSNDVVKFHEDYAREAADLVIIAYRHCNYSKVLEFVQFKDRLQHSHNLYLAKIEGTLLQLKQKAHNPDDVMVVFEKMQYGRETLKWGVDGNSLTLSFNEALDTRPWWSPAPHECILTGSTNEESASELRESKRHQKWRNNLCKRSMLPRLIYLSLEAVGFRLSSRENADPAFANELKDLVGKYGEMLGIPSESLQSMLVDFSLLRSRTMELNLTASDVFNLVLFWTAYEIASEPSTKSVLCLNQLVNVFVSELTCFVKASDDSKEKHVQVDMVASWSSIPSIITLVTEGLTWYVLCLWTWIRNLQPSGKGGKKKKKGVAAAIADVSADSDLLAALRMCVDEFCVRLETLRSMATALSEALDVNNERIYLDLLANGRNGTSLDNEVVKPGLVLDALVSSACSVNEMGEKIALVFETWQSELAFKKLTEGQSGTLNDLVGILSARLKTLQCITQ